MDYFLHEKDSALPLLEEILILVTDLAFLPKPPSADFQNALSTTTVFQTVLLLTKGLSSLPEKSNSGPTVTTPLALPCSQRAEVVGLIERRDGI